MCVGGRGTGGNGRGLEEGYATRPLISPLSPPHCFIYNGVGGRGDRGGLGGNGGEGVRGWSWLRDHNIFVFLYF